ncbi:MAG TPA: lytic transglycosylase domain-containing protein [Bryobacterales bacterium]|nr:lytic transglycosylase domain-containing protein [Bryobacterales bacterium]
MPRDTSRQIYTVAVDARTGKLVRVPARRSTRAVSPKVVSPQPVTVATRTEAPVKERVIEEREVSPALPAQTKAATYNVVPARSFDRLVEQVAGRYQIEPSFIRAVIQAESNYNPRAVSPKGALGLMQLRPQTARRFGVANVFSPAQNLDGGVRYLRYLLDLYRKEPQQSALSLAAYNAGEGAVGRFGGVPPYWETQQYLRRVNRLWQRFRTAEPLTPAPAPKKLEGPRIIETVDDAGVTHFTTESQ